jgi:hypothetical protein
MQRLSGNINKFLPLISFGDNPMRHYRRVTWQRIKSCNLGVWRSDYARVDGFDETFVGWGHKMPAWSCDLHAPASGARVTPLPLRSFIYGIVKTPALPNRKTAGVSRKG